MKDMNTYELLIYPPNSFIPCKWKTAKANSMEEFAEICSNDIFLIRLINSGWKLASIREVK